MRPSIRYFAWPHRAKDNKNKKTKIWEIKINLIKLILVKIFEESKYLI